MSPPRGVVALAESFTLTVYRGEKSEWWPPPETRLANGMAIRQPWEADTMAKRFEKLQESMRENGSGSVAGYAQYLRATGRPFALATARTKGGAFDGYFYEITIPNVRTFLWNDDYTLGGPANFKEVGKTTREERVDGKLQVIIEDKISIDYIVLNADTIADSTILAFGHKTATYEVTFFHDMPIEFVTKINEKPRSTFRIKTKEQVRLLSDTKENKWAKELLRD